MYSQGTVARGNHGAAGSRKLLLYLGSIVILA